MGSCRTPKTNSESALDHHSCRLRIVDSDSGRDTLLISAHASCASSRAYRVDSFRYQIFPIADSGGLPAHRIARRHPEEYLPEEVWLPLTS